MPQLSPMLGFLMFTSVLTLYLVLLCGMSKPHPVVKTTKMNKSLPSSLHFFN